MNEDEGEGEGRRRKEERKGGEGEHTILFDEIDVIDIFLSGLREPLRIIFISDLEQTAVGDGLAAHKNNSRVVFPPSYRTFEPELEKLST
jgi:hypothetical protein